MEKTPERIASFSVNHDYIDEGIYVSRIDGIVIGTGFVINQKIHLSQKRIIGIFLFKDR